MEAEYRRNGFLSEMTYSSVGRKGGGQRRLLRSSNLRPEVHKSNLFVCLFVFMARVGEENRDSFGVSNML